MKNLILAIASVFTTVLILSQTAFAAHEGGSIAAGEDPQEALVPAGANTDAGVALTGTKCEACTKNLIYKERDAHTVAPAVGAGGSSSDQGNTSSGTGEK